MSHTPGPWEWQQKPWNNWLRAEDGSYVLDYAGCGTHDCEVSPADARLIAAAPELLEAAKTAEAELETVLAFVAENDGAAFNAAERALFDLRLAIAKAEGREIE